MLKDIVAVRPLEGHRLWLRFEDGVEGTVDVAELVRFEGVFAPLADRQRFVEVAILGDSGTIGWPGGADLDPDVLYAQIVGVPFGTEIEANRDEINNT
jgi:hypothetical protein